MSSLFVRVVCALALALPLASRTRAQEAPPSLGSPAPPALSPRIMARDRALELHLTSIATEDEGRILNSALQLALGAGFVTAGAILDNNIARSLLLLVGAGALAHGTVRLAMVPNPTKRAQTFAAMPRFSPRELRARIHYGERALDELADGARRTRIVDGTVTMTVAASYVPLWWWLERREDPSYRFGASAFDYVGVAISAINFGTGLVTAIVHGEAERRRDAYVKMRADFEREAPSELERLALQTKLDVAVQPGSVRIGARVAF